MPKVLTGSAGFSQQRKCTLRGCVSGECTLKCALPNPFQSTFSVLPVSGIFCIFAPSLNGEFHNFRIWKMMKLKTFSANRVCVCVCVCVSTHSCLR